MIKITFYGRAKYIYLLEPKFCSKNLLCALEAKAAARKLEQAGENGHTRNIGTSDVDLQDISKNDMTSTYENRNSRL